MKFISRILMQYFLAISLLPFCAYAESKRSTIRTVGDVFQIINPIAALGIASGDKGAGHFAFIYAQEFTALHATKFIGKEAEWSAGKRPHNSTKKNRYDGMPSGHTLSAWSAAAFIRNFKEKPNLSIPFYVTATVTAYSRVKAKEHTIGQVIAGALLSEVITYANSQMEWSKNYAFVSVNVSKKNPSLFLEFRF